MNKSSRHIRGIRETLCGLYGLRNRSHAPYHLAPIGAFSRYGQCYSLRTFTQSRCLLQRKTATKAKVESTTLDTLPQGILEDNGADEQPNAPDEAPTTEATYPTVIQQAKDNMAKYTGCVLITRVGNFYELYFEQATYWGVQLGLKVAYRKTNKKSNVKPVAMSGFPFFQLDRYLRILVHDHNQKVAIAEEVANEPNQRVKSGGLLFDRQVKRIITPGSLIDESFLSPSSHNYLLCVFVPDHSSSELEAGHHNDGAGWRRSPQGRRAGLAWIDLSSGDFSTQTVDISSLSSAIARINPKEIIFDPILHSQNDSSVSQILSECGPRSTFHSVNKHLVDGGIDSQLLDSCENHGDILNLSEEEKVSAAALLSYVSRLLPGLTLRFLRLSKYQVKDHMSIDKHTQRGLEIAETMRDGLFAGSLLHTIQRTYTFSGARLLSERLKAPSTSIKEIDARLDLVEELLENNVFHEALGRLLQKTTDTFRIVQSIACGKGDAESLLSLSRTVELSSQVANVVRDFVGHSPNAQMKALLERFQLEGPTTLAATILAAIDEDGLVARHRQEEDDTAQAAEMAREAIATETSGDLAALHKRLSSRRYIKAAPTDERAGADPTDIWIMRRNASRTLSDLHGQLDHLYADKVRLEESLRNEHGASSLSLRMTPSLGHIVHISGKDTRGSLDSFSGARAVGSSKSTRSFYVSAWTDLGKRLDETKLRIRAEEQQIFRDLRDAVCSEIPALRNNAALVDEMDVASSSALLARERNLVRPVLNDSTAMSILGGRHMTVEAGLEAAGRSFTPNDCQLGMPTSNHDQQPAERIQLITGPNMGGKSTYLRQIALLAVLAQTGLFVPATHATIGIVDAVFSRIGAADNLYNDQSTFMVEMIETAAILKGATPRSLVVMDEVGRGTTPEDGTAVGFAVLDSLRKNQVGRVLFATHFHRLADQDMCAAWPELGLWSTRVVDEDLPDGQTGFRFVHKMERGTNRESHALRVAKLAGMPDATIDTAASVLSKHY